MRSFSLTWSSGIEEGEAVVFVSSVHEALRLAWEQVPHRGRLIPAPEIRPFGDWFLQGVATEADYASFQWYQEQSALHDTGDIRADRFLSLVTSEPWQKESPHFDLSLLHQPLVDYRGETVLGAAARGMAAVLSMHLLHTLTDSWRRLMLLRRLTAHYVGQTLGVPIPTQRDEAHCTNVCAMRPAHTLPMLIAYAEQETRDEILFCERCQVELGTRLADIHFGEN
ncbi:MAG: hypothetical protein JXA09_04740 [Anaerolineae bacterium]|nr:hypothetical protein [Anaerolineae bacterium]